MKYQLLILGIGMTQTTLFANEEETALWVAKVLWDSRHCFQIIVQAIYPGGETKTIKRYDPV